MVPRGTACLVRAVTVDGDAVHDPALTMVIVDRVVLDATVVPKGNCVGAPAEAAGEFGPYQVAVEIVEERRALFFAHAAEADREGAVDEQPLAPGFGWVRMTGCSELLRRMSLARCVGNQSDRGP